LGKLVSLAGGSAIQPGERLKMTQAGSIIPFDKLTAFFNRHLA
jgi:hypothetical protein